MAFASKRVFEIREKLNILFGRKEKLQLLWVIAAALAAALFQALGVVSILPFVELVMEPEMARQNSVLQAAYQVFRFESVFSFTMALGIVLLGILVIGNAVSAAATWLRVRFVWQKNHTISLALLEKYLSMPYAYFFNQHSADLSKNILFEVQQLTGRFLQPVLQVITQGMVVLVILAALLLVHPEAAVGAIVLFGSAYLGIFLLFKNALRTRGEKRLKENTGRFTAAGEALAGVKDIKVLGREQYFVDRFSRHSDRFSALQAWNSVIVSLPRYFMETVAFGGMVLLILFFLGLDLQGSQIIPLVSFFAFAGYRMLPALQNVFHAISEIQFNEAILDTIAGDLRRGGRVSFSPKSRVLPPPLPFKEKVTLRNVSFQYPYTREAAIHEVNLEIRKGVFAGFVGPTGGGKTTLADIMIGLLAPTGGSMEVDGVPIDDGNVRNWQRTLGYVPQQIFLADDTVARNVAFGLADEEIDRSHLERACKIANLHDFVTQELPEGYETVIGERGIRLSGGQRQRIGIARALYHNPEFLVFDEATSALDGTTEKAVLEAIRRIPSSKTLVAIAHRLKTVEKCDMLYFVNRGVIADQGSYGELLERNPRFRAMALESARE